VTWTNFGSADDEQNTTGSLDLNLNCNYVLDTSRPFKIVSTLSVSGGGIFQFVDGFGKTWGVDIAVQYDDLEALTAWGVYLQIDYVTEDITAPPIGKYIKIGSETSRFPFTVRVNTNEGSTDYVVSGKLNNATLVKIGTFSCVIDSFYFVSSPYEDVFRDPTKGMTFVQGV
jgi:hypothetical protein